jgi:hypothetical protein
MPTLPLAKGDYFQVQFTVVAERSRLYNPPQNPAFEMIV